MSLQGNMLTVYNQLIEESPNTDYRLFEKVLKENYEKYKYFYRVFSQMDNLKVLKVYCENSDSHELDITMIFNIEIQEKEVNSYRERFESMLDDDFFNKYFEFDFSQDGNVLNISISAEKKESELYEVRFNSLR